WGDDASGQLGTVTSLSSHEIFPAHTVVVSHATRIAAGGDDSIALGADGTVYTWGFNDGNQARVPYAAEAPLVRPALSPAAFTPAGGTYIAAQSVRVTTPYNPGKVKAFSVGLSHTLALLSDGTVWAWGNNADGQLGAPTGRTDAVNNY